MPPKRAVLEPKPRLVLCIGRPGVEVLEAVEAGLMLRAGERARASACRAAWRGLR